MKAVRVRVGDAYQAEIPPLVNCVGERPPRPVTPVTPTGPAAPLSKCRQRWTPSRFGEQEVTEFLRLCRLHEIEAGLHSLYDGDFQVEKAMRLLQNARCRTLRRQRTRDKLIDPKVFDASVTKHNKHFHRMKQDFDDAVSTKDLVDYYFTWKLTATAAKRRERTRQQQRRELAQLATDEEDDDAWDENASGVDYHNEYCDFCFTGGKLLCCDGCERAFHFSCVNPPIQSVPKGDWFCQYCCDVLRTKALRRDVRQDGARWSLASESPARKPTSERQETSSQPHRNEPIDDNSSTDRDASDEDGGQDLLAPSCKDQERKEPEVVTKESRRWEEATVDPKSPGSLDLSRRKRQRKTDRPRRILRAA